MEAAVNLTPEIIEVENQSLSIPDKAKALKIAGTEDYVGAGTFWKEIRAIRAKVSDCFDPLIKHAHNLHKATLAKKNEIDKPLEDAERIVKRLMSDYDAEQERIRKAEETRLAEIARKEEEERKLQEAILAELEGNQEEAEKIMDAPVAVAPVVVPKSTPKMAGGPVYQTRWKFEVTDEKAVPREYLMIDEKKIGAIVTALKDKTNIPGIRAYSTRV